MSNNLFLRPRHLPHACAHCCPGKQPCCCTNQHPHVLHICSNPDCMCHSRRRYDGYDSAPAQSARSRTQRMALIRLGMLDLRALLAAITSTKEKHRGT